MTVCVVRKIKIKVRSGNEDVAGAVLKGNLRLIEGPAVWLSLLDGFAYCFFVLFFECIDQWFMLIPNM